MNEDGSNVLSMFQPDRRVIINGKSLPAPSAIAMPCELDERGGFVMDLRDRCDA